MCTHTSTERRHEKGGRALCKLQKELTTLLTFGLAVGSVKSGYQVQRKGEREKHGTTINNCMREIIGYDSTNQMTVVILAPGKFTVATVFVLLYNSMN